MEKLINAIKVLKLKKGDVLVLSCIDVDREVANYISKIVKCPIVLVPDVNNIRVIRNELRKSINPSMDKQQSDKDGIRQTTRLS